MTKKEKVKAIRPHAEAFRRVLPGAPMYTEVRDPGYWGHIIGKGGSAQTAWADAWENVRQKEAA